jgi:hypothetical protein
MIVRLFTYLLFHGSQLVIYKFQGNLMTFNDLGNFSDIS